ncbi:TPM domain-containing protein [Mangrovitalea sediminis]|uniref:TPM domain-containing protein n=1 Tax=Mangrovitalea sediminis TaxID=1982043 RepID=UPI000BE53B4E|nr:TPM domain-containing protein [Mangrovitalea sediminis]
MKRLTEQDKQRVADAIAAVEKDTDAELVTVLAHHADDYTWVSTLWAAMIALVVPGLASLGPWWLSGHDWLLLQWVLFVLLAVLFRWQPIYRRLVPKAVRFRRAAALARIQFLAQQLHHTKGDTGVLIFVSEAERYVEILADRGINRFVTPEDWQSIVDNFTRQVKRGETLQGFLDCIGRTGELLKTHVPATESKNELPNHLVIL